jgi:methylated-DNA-protein-cysteine methyltransferase related protein
MRARPASSSATLDDPDRTANNRAPLRGVWIVVTHAESDEPSIAEQVWQVIALIPRGRVATYGQVAQLAGLPGGARRVGHLLSHLPPGSKIPWHRVINASGGISLPEHSGGFARQQRLLKKEGVAFNASGRVSLRRFRWQP